MVAWALCVIVARFSRQQRLLETFPAPSYLCFEDGVVWIWHSLANSHIWLTILSCYVSIPLILALIGSDGVFSSLCHSCRFPFQQRLLKTFHDLGSLRSVDGIVWLCHSLVNLYLWLTISSYYSSILLTLGLIGKDGVLRTPCHSCGFLCRQRVQKTISDPGFLHF